MIEIFPSRLDGAPAETYMLEEATTVEEWIASKAAGYAYQEAPPISVEVDGVLLKPSTWRTAEIGPHSLVRIYVEPKAAAAIGAYVAIIAAAAAAVVATVILTRPKLPSANTRDNGQGKQLGLATVKGNQAKLNDIVREVAGRRKVYPDYLVAPRRYFKEARQQWVELFLCVGVGEFDIPANQILIGDTPISSFGSDASFNLYGPGQSVAGESAADWWYLPDEIGGTSTGTAGLELNATYSVDPQPAADTLIASGYTLSIPPGGGYFPKGWAPGLLLRAEIPYPYSIADGTGPGGRDVITGPLAQLGLTAGMSIEIAGDNPGRYVVNSYSSSAGLTLNFSSGGAVTGLTPGNANMAIGYAGLRYRVVAVSADSTDDHGPSTLTLQRLKDNNEVDTNWPGFDARTTNEGLVTLDQSTLEGAWTGPFVACPEDETTSLMEFDVFFPAGLVILDKKGRPGSYTVQVEFQYRDLAVSGAWTSVRRTYTNNTLDQLGFTERVQLQSAIRPEVRMRRIGADSTSTSIQDTVQWYGLRSRIEGAATSYPGVTTLAVKVRGGGRLGAQAENKISVLCTRILEGRPNRDIAPWVRYVVSSIGYPQERVDQEELTRLDQLWAMRGDTYDQAIEDSTTVKSALAEALQPGYAELTMERGRIKPVRDEPRYQYEAIFTPQDFTEDLKRQFTAISADEFDGVDVEYVDEKTWQKETVECRLPSDQGRRVQKITVEGVTNRDRAWRIGMRQRRTQNYRRWNFTWSTEMSAFNRSYLDFCGVTGSVPGYAQSALLEGFERFAGYDLLTSSEPLDWAAMANLVTLRRPDGSASGPYVATRVNDFQMTVPNIDFLPDLSLDIEPPHLIFGRPFGVLISEVNPGGNTTADVSASNYDERVYADDDSYAPD